MPRILLTLAIAALPTLARAHDCCCDTKPSVVFTGLTKAQAEATAKAQRDAGATVEMSTRGRGIFSVRVELPDRR